MLLGLLVGSFLNVVIYRVPKMLHNEWHEQCCELLEQPLPEEPRKPFNLVTPRSTCPHCGHGIKAWENIPIICYLLLRGRFSACQASISVRYPIIGAVTWLLLLVVIYHFGLNLAGLATLLFSWALIALTIIDIYSM